MTGNKEKKKRKGKDNLRPITTETARERGRAGGLAAARANQKRKTLRAYLEALLDAPSRSKGTSGLTNAEAITVALMKTAKKGSVHAFSTIRDSVGEKPTDRVEHSGQIDLAAAITAGRERVKSAPAIEHDGGE